MKICGYVQKNSAIHAQYFRGYGGIGSFENERRRGRIQRVRKGAATRSIANEREQDDYVASCLAGADAQTKILYAGMCRIIPPYTLNSFAGMAELADAQDLGSCVNSCRFDPCYPHQTKQSEF